MPFNDLPTLLSKLLKKNGIDREIKSAQIKEICVEVIANLVDPSAVRKLQVMEFTNGTLKLACVSSILRDRCCQQEQRIIFELNRPFKQQLVKKIVYVV